MTGDLIFRDAREDDLAAVVRLLADDDLGKTRERDEEPLPGSYRDAFGAIETDPNNRIAMKRMPGRLRLSLEVVGRIRMDGRNMIAGLALGVAACAGPGDEPPAVLTGTPAAPDVVVTSEAPPPVVYERRVHPGDAALSVVGTPFLIAFRGVVCVASLAVAAPVAAVAAVVPERPAYPETQRSLGDGLASNCGPPWVISPYRWVRVDTPPPAS